MLLGAEVAEAEAVFAVARVSVHSIGAVVSAAAESFPKWSN